MFQQLPYRHFRIQQGIVRPDDPNVHIAGTDKIPNLALCAGTHALAPLSGDLSCPFAGIGTFGRIGRGLIGNSIADVAHAVVILPDTLKDPQQNPAQCRQSTQYRYSINTAGRGIQCREQDAFRSCDPHHVRFLLPAKPVLPFQRLTAGANLHQLCGDCL